jgi:hypothetical protein
MCNFSVSEALVQEAISGDKFLVLRGKVTHLGGDPPKGEVVVIAFVQKALNLVNSPAQRSNSTNPPEVCKDTQLHRRRRCAAIRPDIDPPAPLG